MKHSEEFDLPKSKYLNPTGSTAISEGSRTFFYPLGINMRDLTEHEKLLRKEVKEIDKECKRLQKRKARIMKEINRLVLQ